MEYKIRRYIYILLFLALALPLIFKVSVEPGRLKTAERAFAAVEALDNTQGKIALLALDYSPSTRAENEAQALVIFEHLLRRRIPVVLFSLVAMGESALKQVPDDVVLRLMQENPTQRWEYGKDWVNLGFKPGGAIFIQGIAGSEDLRSYFGQDAFGNSLSKMPFFKGPVTLKDISLVGEVTGSFLLPTYIQFLKAGQVSPMIVHGPTSIMIPPAYIYLDSGQLGGLLEGISGAAWYAKKLQERYGGDGENKTLVLNTALGVAQVLILVLIVLGNLWEWRRGR